MKPLLVIISGIFCIAPTVLVGKPLVTSSEDNVARVCLARTETPARLVQACAAALDEPRLTSSQVAELLAAQGDGYLWQNMFAEAEDSYRAATESNAFSIDAWNGLGWALWELSNDEGAYAAFERSLSIEPSVQGLGGKAALARRLGYIDNATAREMLDAALAIDPDYIWAVRELAWTHFEDQNYAQAARTFDEALAIEPRDINARYGLGRSLLSQGEAESALSQFNEVLLDDPNDFGALVYRIVSLRDLDRNAQALRFADRLIEIHPLQNSGYIQRAKALMALERRQDAIDAYVHAESILGPDNAVLYWHADALTTDGQFGAALTVIERGLTLEGADYSDYLLQSYIALELRDYDLARTAAEASLATGVDDPWAHYYIAITLIHDGDTRAGLQRFDRAIQGGLPTERVGAFASELVGAGKFIEAAQLRLRY